MPTGRPGSRWTRCREKTLSLLSVGRERFLRDLVRKWGPPWPIRALWRRRVRQPVASTGHIGGRPALSRVTSLLPGCCTSVTKLRPATCSLMVMQEIRDSEDRGFEEGQYARTEEELYEKALALLEKCKIETRRSAERMPESESTVEPSPIAV